MRRDTELLYRFFLLLQLLFFFLLERGDLTVQGLKIRDFTMWKWWLKIWWGWHIVPTESYVSKFLCKTFDFFFVLAELLFFDFPNSSTLSVQYFPTYIARDTNVVRRQEGLRWRFVVTKTWPQPPKYGRYSRTTKHFTLRSNLTCPRGKFKFV